ncbi:MAG: type 4a pilus biogenesis protein PilO [Betaproteobacteria bacterium]
MKATALSVRKRMPSIDFGAIASDFKHLNPNDVGTWPIIPRVVVLFLMLCAIILAGWFFLWGDQFASLENKEKEEEKFKQDYLDKKRQAINLDLYKQQLNEIDQTFGALLKQLPNKSEMEALLTEINQSGLGRGLQFESFVPGQEQIRDFYAELPITVKLTGNYNDFGAFASDIAKLPRIVTLNNISIAPLPTGKLSLDATTKTFRYLDEEEVAKQKQAAKPGAKK